MQFLFLVLLELKFPFEILRFTVINYLEFSTILTDLLLNYIEINLLLEATLIQISNMYAVQQLKKISKSDYFVIQLVQILGFLLLKIDLSLQSKYLLGNLNFIATNISHYSFISIIKTISKIISSYQSKKFIPSILIYYQALLLNFKNRSL